MWLDRNVLCELELFLDDNASYKKDFMGRTVEEFNEPNKLFGSQIDARWCAFRKSH